MSTPRPTRATDEMMLSAASVVAKRLLDQHLIEASDLEAAAKDIASCRNPHADGYEIAKHLEDRHYWTVNMEYCEVLDDFPHEVGERLRAAEKEWATAANLTPPFADGTRVKLIGSRRIEYGTIDGVYDHGPGKFAIKIEGDPQADGPHRSRRIVNFEDVEAAPSDPGKEGGG